MKRNDAKSVGEIINFFLQKEHLDGKIDEQRVIDSWPKIVGPVVNRYTFKRYIINGTLYVHISSPSLRNELMLHRSQLIASINKFIGHPTITNIIFR